MADVKLKHVFKVFDGGVRAVNDFDLDIKDKEFIVFVGPSGCGKSTTLRMIAGLEEITSGSLYIDGELMNDVDSKNRDIAMVFQSYALYPHMTVYDNMAFGLKLRHVDRKEIDERVKKAAETLEISDLLSRKPKALSGGQRQRVALGRTIVREPKVFLLDEPLSNLDAKLRVAMRSEITKLHQKLKTTFIYVTHDQTEAMTMGSRIVVMKGGFIQQADAPIALFEDPCNLFVATFLGSPQMNIIPAILKRNEAGKASLEIGPMNLEFPTLKSDELAFSSFFDKEVKFGIRPENITVGEGDIKAYIEVAEHLGDQTILYCKVDGIEQNVVAKIPFDGQIKSQTETHISFDLRKGYLFDPETEKSILGVPGTNIIPAKFAKDLVVGNQIIDLGENLSKRILDHDEDVFVSFKSENVSLANDVPSIKLRCVPSLVEERTNYKAVFAKIENVNSYVVYKVPNDTVVTLNKEIEIFVPYERVTILDKDLNSLVSREEIVNPTFEATVSNKDGVATISFAGNKLAYKTDSLEDGKYNLSINMNGPKVVFGRKLLKEHPELSNEGKDLKNVVKVNAYDEYVLGSKNAIYVEMKGVEKYMTFVVDNNFSVYKMPAFSVSIGLEDLVLNKID